MKICVPYHQVKSGYAPADELLYSDFVYLNTVGDDTSHKNATTTWNVQVTINKMVLLFKVDTATAMSESAWKLVMCNNIDSVIIVSQRSIIVI